MISVSTLTTLQDAASATADGASLNVTGRSFALFQVTGTFTATITWEGSLDGANWIGVPAADLNSTTRAKAATASAAGLFLIDSIGGLALLRARVTWTSGTSVTIIARASDS